MITTIKLVQCGFVVSFWVYKIAALHTMEGVIDQDAVQIEIRIEEQHENCVVVKSTAENEMTFVVVCDTSVAVLENGCWSILDGINSTSYESIACLHGISITLYENDGILIMSGAAKPHSYLLFSNMNVNILMSYVLRNLYGLEPRVEQLINDNGVGCAIVATNDDLELVQLWGAEHNRKYGKKGCNMNVNLPILRSLHVLYCFCNI